MTLENVMKPFRRATVGASAESLADVAAKLGVSFPPDYLAFMVQSNGGEGPLEPGGHLRLWPAEELVKMNEGYSTAEFFPNWVFIGTDGGGEAVAVRRGSTPAVALVPFVGSEEDAVVGGDSFEQFLTSYATGALWKSRRA